MKKQNKSGLFQLLWAIILFEGFRIIFHFFIQYFILFKRLTVTIFASLELEYTIPLSSYWDTYVFFVVGKHKIHRSKSRGDIFEPWETLVVICSVFELESFMQTEKKREKRKDFIRLQKFCSSRLGVMRWPNNPTI